MTASEDRSVRVWDPQTGKEKRKIDCIAALYGVAVSGSANNQRIVAAAADGVIRVWDATTGSILLEFKGHDDKVWAASLDFNALASGLIHGRDI